MKDILNSLKKQVLKPKWDGKMIDPSGDNWSLNSPTPTKEPFIGPTRMYRNPKWTNWNKINPKGYEELLSGTTIASKETGVPQEMLMDLAGLESSGGQFMKQLSGGPGRGFYQFEPGQKHIPQGFDPNSATESSRLAGKRISTKNLSNWGTPEGGWGSLNNSKNSNGKMTDFYTKEELNKYLSPRYQFK